MAAPSLVVILVTCCAKSRNSFIIVQFWGITVVGSTCTCLLTPLPLFSLTEKIHIWLHNLWTFFAVAGFSICTMAAPSKNLAFTSGALNGCVVSTSLMVSQTFVISLVSTTKISSLSSRTTANSDGTSLTNVALTPGCCSWWWCSLSFWYDLVVSSSNSAIILATSGIGL